jgi:MFS family permease
MQKFTLIWLAQMISTLGTAATRFALLIWAYEQTGQATPLALLGFFSFILYVLLNPLGGIAADRFDRRLIIIAGDLGAAAMTGLMLTLYSTGRLEIWHLYAAEAMTGAFEAFQLPAWRASVSLLVPKAHYGRASGMNSLAQALAQVFAPVFAGRLMPLVGIGGIMILDLASFFIGILPLLFIRFPHPAQTAEMKRAGGRFWQDLTFGFHYIFARKGLPR